MAKELARDCICGNKLLQETGDGVTVRIQGALKFGKDGVARAKCFWCKRDVELPELRLVPSAPPPRLVVRAPP